MNTIELLPDHCLFIELIFPVSSKKILIWFFLMPQVVSTSWISGLSICKLYLVRWFVFCFRHDCYVCTDNMEGIDVHHWQWISRCRCSFWKYGTGLQTGKQIVCIEASVILYLIFFYNNSTVSSRRDKLHIYMQIICQYKSSVSFCC